MNSQRAWEDSEQLERAGRSALREGDTVRAEQYLVLATQRGANRERILPLLIGVCLDGGRLRSALGYAKRHLDRHPEQLELRLLVATIHAGLGQQQAATAQLERLLDYDNDYLEAHYLLGVLLKDKQPHRAGGHLQEYIELAPHGPRVAEVRGWLNEILSAEARVSEIHPETEP